ncbi:hypothetical protein SVIOM74S_04127 [Streptomyces violarus]
MVEGQDDAFTQGALFESYVRGSCVIRVEGQGGAQGDRAVFGLVAEPYCRVAVPVPFPHVEVFDRDAASWVAVPGADADLAAVPDGGSDLFVQQGRVRHRVHRAA